MGDGVGGLHGHRSTVCCPCPRSGGAWRRGSAGLRGKARDLSCDRARGHRGRGGRCRDPDARGRWTGGSSRRVVGPHTPWNSDRSGGQTSGRGFGTKGFAYLDLALYHPPVNRFLEMRQELGVRNVFHPIARMLNPARATSQVIGLSHPPYFEKTVEALRMLSCPRALVIRGVEGDPELSIGSVTRYLELQGERITPGSFHPKDAGLTMTTFKEMAGFPAEHRAKEVDLIKRLLSNQIQGGPRDWVLLNAAMLLYAAGKGTSIAGGVATARRIIESGQAAAKFAELTAAGASGGGLAQTDKIPA
ncbi:MAG: hypothetical protein U0231_07690 [Nitrospiraceae bacterium]